MTRIPENFAKYKVEKVLGEGAMGIVYAGYDPGIGRKVAIKTIHAHLLQGDEGEELRRRFTVEVKASGKLSHPNIVAIYDTDEITDEDGNRIPYFVMEFVDGKELGEYLADGVRFPLSKAIDIACQILDAFAYCHKLGIIHRDVKPANVFLADDNRVKIADFGIARVDNSSMTQTGAVVGTPNYMSPEQCSGQSIDARSDLFSIAVVIYELLSGEKPFAANSVHATMHKVMQSNPEPPSAFNPSIPKSLDAILAKALAKSPDDRYQDADSFAKALGPLRGGQAAADATQVGGHDATVIKPRATSSRKPTARPLVAGVAAALALSVSAGAGYWWWNQEQVSSSGSGQATNQQEEAINPEDLDPFATDLSLEKQQKVERLLGVAATHEKADRLIFPDTSSAYYLYDLVLEIDPGNPRAEYGKQKIADELERKAEQYYQDRDFETLSAHLEGSLEAFPDNKKLQELNQKLSQLRAGVDQ